MQDKTDALSAPLDRLKPAASVYEYDVAWELRDTFHLQTACKDHDGRIFLYGRDLAQVLLARLKPEIEKLPGGEVLVLRLDRIRITPEFADEMVYNLVCRDDPRTRLVKEKIVVLANPDEGTKIGLHLALEKEKDAAMVLETAGDVWNLSYIGRIQPHLFSILEYVRSHDSLTSKELAAEFNFKLADASRRLKELYEDGFIRRVPSVSEDGNLNFTYSYFHPARAYEPDCPLDRLPYDLYQTTRPTSPSMHSAMCE